MVVRTLDIKGFRVKMKSDEVLCIIRESGVTPESLRPLLGLPVRFVKEPDNPYDRNAVAVYYQYDKLGYVYKNGAQGIINEWLDKKYPIFAYICDIQNNYVHFIVSLYVPENEFDIIKFRIKRPTNKILDCYIGEGVLCYYDDENYKYIVYDVEENKLGTINGDDVLDTFSTYEGKIVEMDEDKKVYSIELKV